MNNFYEYTYEENIMKLGEMTLEIEKYDLKTMGTDDLKKIVKIRNNLINHLLK